MNILEKEFKDKVIIKAGILLFSADDAITLIGRCQQLGLKILGIDAFKVTANTTQPILKHSIDYSKLNSKIKEDNWSIAKNFLKERKNLGLVFEIIYE